jgi:hypothetical protein
MEQWRTVGGYEGLYEVSDQGDVRSARRRKGSRGGPLKQALTGGTSPRLCVVLYKDGKKKTRLVHHLVLEAFTGPRPTGQEACHGPGGALDNRHVNLYWGTREQNQADRVRDGTSNRGERQWQARLTADVVTECRRRYAAGETQVVLAAEFGVSQAHMSAVITGAVWSWLPGAVPIDRARHGRGGAAHHAARLTPELIEQARQRWQAGERQKDIAASMGVAQPTLSAALRGYTWKDQASIERLDRGDAPTVPYVDKSPGRVSLHAKLRSAPDDAVITGWAEDFGDYPNVTYADTPDGLRTLAAILNAECQGQIDPHYIEEQICHEGQHADAARAAGFTKIRYGLGVWRERRDLDIGYEITTRWQVLMEHVAPVRPFTKLMYAAITAAPTRLSAGDEAALREMGYRDAADVAARVRLLS